jgi:hypothetical protein
LIHRGTPLLKEVISRLPLIVTPLKTTAIDVCKPRSSVLTKF